MQNYYEYITKKHETLTYKSPIQIYSDKIQKIITFKIKSKYYLELLAPETVKQRGSNKRRATEEEMVRMHHH